MKTGDLKVDKYIVYTILSGFLIYAWLIVLMRTQTSNQGIDALWPFIVELLVVTLSLVASLLRRPWILLVFSILGFLPLGLYTLTGESIAQLAGLGSLTCLLLSCAIIWNEVKNRINT